MPEKRPPIRRKAKRKDTRNEIRDAALGLFAERGFDATSIGEIAKAAGVPKANVLYYFADKAELWKEAIDRHWAQVDAFYEEHLPKDTAPDRDALRRFLLVYFEACCRFPPYVQIMNLEGHSATWRNDWLAQKHLKRHIDAAHPLFTALMDAGVVKKQDMLVFQTLLTGGGQLLIGQFQLWLEATGEDPRDPQFRENYADAIISLIS